MKSLAMESIMRVLSRGAWFSRQPANVQRLLVGAGRIVIFSEGAWIFGATEEATGLFAILDGFVRGYAALSRQETVLVELAGPGAWFGQVSALRTPRRLVTAMAATPAQLLHIPRSELLRLTKAHPAIWEAFAELNQLQMQRVISTLAETLKLPPRARVAARLVSLIPRPLRKGSAAPVFKLTQADLAEMIGLERKAVHRILKEFESQGLIATAYGTIRILHRRGLEDVRDASFN